MANTKSRFQRIKQEARAVWDEQFDADQELTRLHRFLHFWVLVVKSFNRNRCPIRASALSFTTLLALIPILAVAISITSALLKKQGEEHIYHFVDKFVSAVTHTSTATNTPPSKPSQDSESIATNPTIAATETNSTTELAATNNSAAELQTNQAATTATASGGTNAIVESGNNQVTDFQKEAANRIHEFVKNTRSGTLGFTGAILLVIVGIRMFGTVESTFNDIWGVTRGRNWFSRIGIYCTGIVVGPMLIVGASSVHFQSTQRLVAHIPIIGPMIFPVLTLVVLWFAFALFYQFVPNTKVRFNAALVGGVIGGTVWHVNNLFGFLYVSRVVSNSKIYGSLGLVPVFMAGIYFSWYILLFGAQIAYAFQNRALYLQERIAENVNQRGREFVALRLMTCIGQRFQRGLPAPTSQEMSGELCIPSRLVQQVLQTLISAHLVIEVSGAEAAYTPGRPLEQITAHHILQSMRARGQELLTRNEPVREEVYGEFARIEEAEKKAASSLTMLTLVHRADARLELAPVEPAQKDTVILPALIPVEPATTEPTPAPPQPETFQGANEPPKPEPAAVSEVPAPSTAVSHEVSQTTKSIAEPVSDEERDFPL
ncbi:MAG TPA: YhjD/YihY/BrkB family envelope integrity protein [Candidatus Angelobacter sp.]|nr:YhjD/YihY/BrkB family envelope integrity protein [Candidatus Angelobacter sp.]